MSSMIKMMNINGRECIVFGMEDFTSLLKLDKEIDQSDLDQIIELFKQEYMKYLNLKNGND